MDNESTPKTDVSNTSTQKTVRLKPLVKQPVIGAGTTESQSVKKVSTNSGTFPKVGTQTGRISSIATNTARVVRINTALKNNTSNATGSSTTMFDFKTSELQMASPAQNAPNTTRPTPAPAGVLGSLNLKPKVAEATAVEQTANNETKTAAVPKAPPPVKPNIKLSTNPPPLTPPAAPTVPAPATPGAVENTQTAAVTKPPASKPVINLNSKPVIPTPAAAPAQTAAPADNADDATVKLKRPAKPATAPAPAQPTPAAAPAQPAPAAAPAAPKISVPTPASAATANKSSAAPTVKFNLSQSQAAPASKEEKTVAFPSQNLAAAQPAPAVPSAPKLGLKKAEPEAAPAAAPAPAPETVAAPASEAPAEGAPKTKKKKSVAAAAAAGAAKSAKKAAPKAVSQDMPAGFHFSVAFLTAIALVAAAVFCCVQYLNIYQPTVFGKYIQIPFMEQVGK